MASRVARRERAGGVGREIDASARCVKGAAGRVLITGQFGLLIVSSNPPLALIRIRGDAKRLSTTLSDL